MTTLRVSTAKAAMIGCLVCAAGLAQAVPPEGDEKPRPPAEESRQREQPGGPEAILNREQRAMLREYMEENGKELRSFGQKLQRARQEFKEALLADKADEELIKEKAQEIADLHAKRLLMHAEALDRIRPTLTPEQLERLRKTEFPLEPGPGIGGEVNPRFRPPQGDREFRKKPLEDFRGPRRPPFRGPRFGQAPPPRRPPPPEEQPPREQRLRRPPPPPDF